ncbi:MAG: CsgE family curli-type amyloid fiber assembly protein [Salinimicrobium sp.]
MIVGLLLSNPAFSQFYNEEIVARIKVEDKGEFINFSATAENKTPADRNLEYEFVVIKKDRAGNTSRTSQGDRFFLKAHEKLILSTTEVNRSAEGNVIVFMIIYDQDRKPIGKDRLEFQVTESSINEIKKKNTVTITQDEAPPQDGFVLNGLVIENTLTKAGRDFYRYFYSEFYNREIVTPYNITIDEEPSRGRMTRISVSVGDQLVMRFFARPKKEYLKQMAMVSLQRSLAHLQKLQQQANSFKHY